MAANKYYGNSILAIAMVASEKYDLYQFVFESYVAAGFNLPLVVYTDQQPCFLKFFDKNNNAGWKCRHFLCTFHIIRNIQKSLANYLKVWGLPFKSEFVPVLKETRVELFEEKFKTFREKYEHNVQSESSKKIQQYLDGLYLKKEKWAYCYTSDIFTAGMRSTQRNESINHKIKTFILSCIRTNICRLVEIFKIIKDEEMEKLDQIKLKIKSKQFGENDHLFNQLLKVVSPVIASKIYLQYSKSFGYKNLKYHNASNNIIVIICNKDAEYEVNLIINSCSCHRLIYVGIPCSHIFAAWRYSMKDIFKEVMQVVHLFWKIDRIDNSESHKDKTMHFQDNKFAYHKSPSPKLKSKKTKENDPDLTGTDPVFDSKDCKNKYSTHYKRRNINNRQSFNFVKWTNNSCRYDTILAFLKFFIENKSDSIFKEHLSTFDQNFKSIMSCVTNLNEVNMERSQQTFIRLIHSYTESANEAQTGYGSLINVFNNLFKRNIPSFNGKFTKTVVCDNAKCSENKAKYEQVFGPFMIVNIKEFHNQADKGIVLNWFNKNYTNCMQEQLCAHCIDTQGKSDYRIKITNQVSELPKFLNLCLESLVLPMVPNTLSLREACDQFEIELRRELFFCNKSYMYQLICVFILQESNHFTLYYKDPSFQYKCYKGWHYYNDLTGRLENEDVLPPVKELIRMKKISILLVYKLM